MIGKIHIISIVQIFYERKMEEYKMKKTWMNAEAEELSLEMTQNGLLPDDDFDGPWQQLSDGKWWRPGNGRTSTN